MTSTLYIDGWRIRQVAARTWHASKGPITIKATTQNALKNRIWSLP